MPSAKQRTEIEYLLADARVLEAQGKEAERDPEKNSVPVMEEIGRMIVAKSSSKLDDGQIQARGSAYKHVLSKEPVWAVREAIIRWHRGDYRDIPEQEFCFAAQPHRLLKMVKYLKDVLASVIRNYERILAAEAEYVATPEEAEQNLLRLREVMQEVARQAHPAAVKTPALPDPVRPAAAPAPEKPPSHRESTEFYRRMAEDLGALPLSSVQLKSRKEPE